MYRFQKQLLSSVARPGFVRTRAVRFQDVDAAGVIFYPMVLEYCHDLYVEFLEAHDTSLHHVLQAGIWAAPIRHAEVDYLKPLRLGQRIEVALCLAHLQPSEVTLGYRVTLAEQGETAAVAQTVHTFVSLPTFVRTEIPAELVTAFQSMAQ
jgi:1,4-dihydroxy-2-naphthoyl-CoA hydrolase